MNQNHIVKKYLNKDDYKRYRDECAKIALIYASIENQKITQALIQKEKITCLFGFEYDDTINKNNVKNKNNLLNFDFHSNKHINDGLIVGNLAKDFFKSKTTNWKDLDIYSQSLSLKKTAQFIKSNTYDVLFEPVFVYENCITRCDVMRKFLDGWELIEVKAVNKLKKEHLYDVIFQYYVLSSLGIKIYSIKLMYLNKNYILEDLDGLDLDSLFILASNFKYIHEDIDFLIYAKEYCEEQKLKMELEQLASLIFNKNLNLEVFLLEKTCNNGHNNYCTHVINYIPPVDTIFNLYRLRLTSKIKFYYDENILYLTDINLSHNYFHNFNDNQKRQILTVQNNDQIIRQTDKKYVLEIFEKYQYPIYMYDFETVQCAVPKFVFSHSYQQIPFQYSIHVLKNEHFNYKNNDNIEHFYYLNDGVSDPRVELIKKIVKDCFALGKGVYVAYNKSFEVKILQEAIDFIIYDLNNNKKIFDDHLELVKKLTYIKNHTIDLMNFFNNFLTYKKEFNGSLSIKNTLPAFDKKFSYKHLKIQKGDIASEIYWKRIEDYISINEWKECYEKEMIKYCNQDTLGMVVLFKEVSNLIKSLI